MKQTLNTDCVPALSGAESAAVREADKPRPPAQPGPPGREEGAACSRSGPRASNSPYSLGRYDGYLLQK